VAHSPSASLTAICSLVAFNPTTDNVTQTLISGGNLADIELDDRGNVKASEKNYQTSIAKIFTAGDMRRGQSLVVWAISEGRECARKVDEYLIGVSQLERKDASLIAL